MNSYEISPEDADRLPRLPKWAQHLIVEQARRINELTAQVKLVSGDDASALILADPHSEFPQALGVGREIRFWITQADGRRAAFDVRVRGHALDVMTDDGYLTMLGSSGVNTARLVAVPDRAARELLGRA